MFYSDDDSGPVCGFFECHTLPEGGAFIATGSGRRAPVIGDRGRPLCHTIFAGILQRNRGGFRIMGRGRVAGTWWNCIRNRACQDGEST